MEEGEEEEEEAKTNKEYSLDEDSDIASADGCGEADGAKTPKAASLSKTDPKTDPKAATASFAVAGGKVGSLSSALTKMTCDICGVFSTASRLARRFSCGFFLAAGTIGHVHQQLADTQRQSRSKLFLVSQTHSRTHARRGLHDPSCFTIRRECGTFAIGSGIDSILRGCSWVQ